MSSIYSTVACNLDADILSACLPLLQSEKVEAIEWSFDALYQQPALPEWFDALLHAYGNQGRLIGHGVFFSLFSGKWLHEQDEWLLHLRNICKQYKFDHITEHFGFMTGSDFHSGAPLGIPYTRQVLEIGIDRLKRIADACQCPVGLENLAFSYSADGAQQHGDFLRQLIEPVNGFIILDLHNVYCQSHNFSIPLQDLVSAYPLDKVREIHISGGSWQPADNAPLRKVRRDTHDDAVPAEVFAALGTTINKCPHLKFVVLEQLGNALHAEGARQQFQTNFIQMDAIVQSANQIKSKINRFDFMPPFPMQYGAAIEDNQLYQQQVELSQILESADSADIAITALQTSSLSNTAWRIENWQPYMIDTARKIAQKWKKDR